MKRIAAFALATLVFVPVVVVRAADEGNGWARFRGPNGSGISGAEAIPIKWTAEEYNWTVKLPGDGSSSPAVSYTHLTLPTKA